ncbi:MAG: serpin family protein [Deltaproteobacteria bacterium]|nr:serpin family protein [Deltaproteobacteria bacterium]
MKAKKSIYVLLCSTLLCTTFACAQSDKIKPALNFKNPLFPEQAIQIDEQVSLFNKTSLHITSQAFTKEENLFLSPFSVMSVFGMAYAGAEGQTKEEIATALGFPRDIKVTGEKLNAMQKALLDVKGIGLAISNNLWKEETLPVKQSFHDYNKLYYNGQMTPLSFIKSPEESRNIINERVKKDTRGKIIDLIPAGAITPATRLVLTNAVYFLADWQHKFKANQTKEDKFYISPQQTVSRAFMNDKSRYRYLENEQMQMLELPYINSYSMIVALPKEGIAVESLFKADLPTLISSLAQSSSQEVQLALPKFEFRKSQSLRPLLESMGIKEAFRGTGLSGITDETLLISDVFHQAYVKVNEQGTEAAAATAMVMRMMALPLDQPKIFRANRPFLFMIRHNQTGLLLFIGVVTNPQA